MKAPLAIFALLTVLITACTPANDTSEMVDEGGADLSLEVYEAQLSDVNGGDATGTATATFSARDSYDLSVAFENLPELEEGYFYEGWIVSPEGDVLSTGALEQVGKADSWANTYQSDENLTNYDTYILTLEPDDGDPAPAEHVLEGTFTLIIAS